jgi:hypothetical protein
MSRRNGTTTGDTDFMETGIRQLQKLGEQLSRRG